MDILDGMGVCKLSAKIFFKVNYSFKKTKILAFSLYDFQVSGIQQSC